MIRLNYIHVIMTLAHVSFGQRQDMCLGADQKTCVLWEQDCGYDETNASQTVIHHVKKMAADACTHNF